MLLKLLERWILPRHFERRQPRGNTPNTYEDGFTSMCREEAECHTNQSHNDLLHLCDSLHLWSPWSITLLLPQCTILLQAVAAIQDPDEEDAKDQTDWIDLRNPLHRGQDVSDQPLAMREIPKTKEVASLLHDDQQRSTSDKATESRHRQEPHSTRELEDAHQNQGRACNERQHRCHVCTIHDIIPRPQLVRYEDCSNGP
mmetsp:Transcript_52086/g.124025  ORF Transcript_52086/g.124025 Transcript_52086/m.124025 type:complete len:200 (-) Transcript_52086:503-1102(-)